jgi:hypothetical protein
LFSRSKLAPHKVMKLLYWWLVGDSHTSMKTKGRHSDKTVTQLITDANDIVSNMLTLESTKIGGLESQSRSTRKARET